MEGDRRGTLDIIIPVYNKAAYLERCVHSALMQSYAPSAVILVDDGSTDGSGVLCDELAKTDDRIKVIHRENGGSSAARNTGLDYSAGDYVGFLDADDHADADMYGKLIAAIEANEDKDIFVSQLMNRKYRPDGTLFEDAERLDGKTELIGPSDFYEQLILHKGDSSMCTKVFKGELIRRFRFEEGKANEDFELLLRMLPSLGEGILSLGTPGYNIELSEGSNTRGAYRQSFYEDMMANAFKALRLANETYQTCISQARRFTYVQALDFLLHIPVGEMKRSNAFYMRILRYLKSEKNDVRNNPYLSRKQREYLIMLIDAPVLVRGTHRLIMKLRKQK